MKSLVQLNTIDDLNDFLKKSRLGPVLIFKHSATCGTSAYAYEELNNYLQLKTGGIDTGIVIVQSSRPVSNAIEERFQVKHQSPQAILVHHNKVLWHKSHYSITTDSILQAVLDHTN